MLRHPLNNFAFVGARGAGKSKLSRKLSKRLNRVVFSTDTLVCYEAGGKRIQDIVADEGWPAFREREYNVLRNLSGMRDIFLDCGGGLLVEAPDLTRDPEAVERFSKRKAKLLKDMARVIYVQRDLDWLVAKAGEHTNDGNRPNLGGDYRRLLERRLPWYESVADYTLDMRHRSLEDALDLLDRELSQSEF